jgi:hypothetical protein
LHVGFLGDITADGLETTSGGNEFLDAGNGLGQSWLRDISEKDVGALLGKEDGGFEADAAGRY